MQAGGGAPRALTSRAAKAVGAAKTMPCCYMGTVLLVVTMACLVTESVAQKVPKKTPTKTCTIGSVRRPHAVSS
jgi:hypothetical protein